MSHSSEAAKTQPSKTVIGASTRVYEQVRRVLSTSRIQAEVERFLIEIAIYWMIMALWGAIALAVLLETPLIWDTVSR